MPTYNERYGDMLGPAVQDLQRLVIACQNGNVERRLLLELQMASNRVFNIIDFHEEDDGVTDMFIDDLQHIARRYINRLAIPDVLILQGEVATETDEMIAA